MPYISPFYFAFLLTIGGRSRLQLVQSHQWHHTHRDVSAVTIQLSAPVDQMKIQPKFLIYVILFSIVVHTSRKGPAAISDIMCCDIGAVNMQFPFPGTL